MFLKGNPSKFAAIFLCFFASGNAYAVNLSNALEKALINSTEIKLEKSRYEQIEATKGDAVSNFLPDVKASFQYGRQKNDAIDLNRQELDKMTDQNYKQVNLSQPIFNGLKNYNHLKEIDYNIKAAKHYYYAKKDEILLESVSSYLNLLMSRNTYKLKTENLNISLDLLELIEQRNALGRIGKIEKIRYETSASAALSEKLIAKKDLLKAEAEYRRIFGNVDENLSLPEIIEGSIPNDILELEKLAKENNPSLRNYHFKILSAKSAYNKAKGEFSPTIALDANLSEQQNVTYIANKTLRSESLYININVPIFKQGTEYFGLKKANRNLNFTQNEYQVNYDNIIQDLIEAHKEYQFYKDIIKAHNELTKLTEDRVQKIAEQTKFGRGDIIDLYNAKIELNKILEEDLKNKTEYVAVYYKLLIIIGELKI